MAEIDGRTINEPGQITFRMQPAVLVALAGAIALAVGSFLPWMKISAPLLGTVTKSGMEGGDGLFTLGAGIVVGILAMVMATGNRSRALRVVMILLACASAMLLAYEFVDVTSRMQDIADSDAGSLVASSYGAGLWLCGLGALAAAVGGALGL